MKPKLILLFLLAIPGLLLAQDISFMAQAPRQVSIGQQFQLTFTINAEGSNFMAPEISNFDILNGPMVSSGQNIMNINGKMEYSSSMSFTFILEATKAGTFTIPQAVISVKGKRYMSNATTITVLNQSQRSTQQPSQNNNQSQGNTQLPLKDDIGGNVFLKAVVDKNNPYQGECVTVTFKLYTPTNRLQIDAPEKIPSYPGFWAQDLLKDATQYPQYTETYNGKKYIVAELRKAALYPQKSGTLTIDPLVQDVIYQVRIKSKSQFADDPFFGNDPFFKNLMDDSFFGNDYQNVKKTLRSSPITINVKPLPAANRPLNFSGAVGQFSMKANVDRTEVNNNDGITLRVSVTGTGNLNLIEKPAINFPADFEVYEPKIIDNFSIKGGTSGTRTFEYLIIPRAAGDFTIDPIQYSYFNPAQRDYSTMSSERFRLKVRKGNGSSAEATAQGDVKYLGNDIRYLMEPPLNIHLTGHRLYGKLMYWILLIIPVLAFVVFILLHQRNMRMKGDAKLMQRKKATRIAVKRLHKAKKMLDSGQQEAFHEEISFALWGYISHKFNIPMSLLSMDTAREQLEMRNVENALTDRFMSTLHDCNFARYAPAGKALNMQQLYDLAIKTISETEQVLR